MRGWARGRKIGRLDGRRGVGIIDLLAVVFLGAQVLLDWPYFVLIVGPMGWSKLGPRVWFAETKSWWQEWEYGAWRWEHEEFYPGHGAFYYYWETYTSWQRDDDMRDFAKCSGPCLVRGV